MEWIGQKYRYDDFPRERIIGEFRLILPPLPSPEDIHGYKKKKHLQKFPEPDEDVVASIDYKMKHDKPLTEEEVEFIKEERRRVKNGFWFYNNGYLEYVTGLHYFYLSAWKIPTKKLKKSIHGDMVVKRGMNLPDFIDSDRDRFYVWGAHNIKGSVVHSPYCFGLVEVTNRRDGKTHRANCTAYHMSSNNYEANSAIQSKTNEDASNVFKKLIKSWKKLPEYYKPVDTGETSPSKILRFDEPSKRSSKNQNKDYSKTLGSSIYYTNSKEVALDGSDIIFTIQDEVGKTNPKEAKVDDRWDVVKETLADGNIAAGKGLLTTTVEDMEKEGGKFLYNIWKDSSQKTIGSSKQTPTGLYRFFKPGYYGFRGEEGGESFIDEYGYSRCKKAKDYQLKRRSELHGRKLISYRRKYPHNEEDAFLSESEDETFPSYKMYEQLNYNESIPKSKVVRGNFIWTDKENLKVEFRADENGRWKVAWMPENSDRCSFNKRGGVYFPVTKDVVAGVDPYDQSVVTGGRKSDAGMYFFREHNPLDIHESNMFVCQYLFRRNKVSDFHDDVLKTVVFYSCEILIERDKPGLIEFLNLNGFGGYIMKTVSGDWTKADSNKIIDGVSMSGRIAREAAVNGLEEYAYDFIGKISEKTQEEQYGLKGDDIDPSMHGNCYFDELLKDMIDFNSEKWTDYDATVAAMITYLAVKNKNKRGRKKKVSKEKLPSIFKTRKL